MNGNLSRCHNLIWGQCINTLLNKAKEDKQLQGGNLDSDSIEVLKITCSNTYKFKHNKYKFQTLDKVMDKFSEIKQYKRG